LERLRKTTKNIIKITGRQGRDLNPGPPEYKAAALTMNLESSSGIQYFSTGQLITASNVEVVSPQIQQQQAAKSSGETLHWKDTTHKKQRRGSQQDVTLAQSVLSDDAEKMQGNGNKLTIFAVENNPLFIYMIGKEVLVGDHSSMTCYVHVLPCNATQVIITSIEDCSTLKHYIL
jgi:hypothetical protein